MCNKKIFTEFVSDKLLLYETNGKETGLDRHTWNLACHFLSKIRLNHTHVFDINILSGPCFYVTI